MLRAVSYCRVSTDSEDQLNSLQNQIEFFDDYFQEQGHIKANCGILCKKDKTTEPLTGIYADEGLTGTSLRRREAFKQMMKDARKGLFDIIYTKSVARFGRSVEDTAKAVKDLKELGIAVYFMDLKVNSLDNSKEFIINLFSALAQEESNNKSYIVQFGIRKAQKQGKWTTGNPPYGYDIVNGYLQVNQKEAEIVKKIFHLYYNEGYGTSKIARLLMQENIPTKKGKKWSQPTICRILDNPIYTGKQIQHIEQITDVNRRLIKRLPEEEWIVHEFDHLKIIDKELFEAVQIERKSRLEIYGDTILSPIQPSETNGDIQQTSIRKRGRYSGKYLLSNLLFCDNCGTSLKRKRRKTSSNKDIGFEWCCTMNDRYGKAKCLYRNAYPEEYLENYIKEKIADRIKNIDELKDDFDLYLKAYYNCDDSTEKISQLKSDISFLKKKREINFDMFARNVIDEEEYLERNRDIEEELKAKKQEYDRIINIDKEINEAKTRYDLFVKNLQNIDLNNLSNVILRRIISKVIIRTKPDNSKEINIIWRFMDKSEEEIAKELTLVN